MRDALRSLIDQLRLHGMAEVLDGEIERAEREAVPPSELLHRLLAQEAAFRRERSLAWRLREARLPWRWTLDSFPFDRQPAVSKAQIKSLAGLDFLRRAHNILLIGKPGTGKTGQLRPAPAPSGPVACGPTDFRKDREGLQGSLRSPMRPRRVVRGPSC